MTLNRCQQRRFPVSASPGSGIAGWYTCRTQSDPEGSVVGATDADPRGLADADKERQLMAIVPPRNSSVKPPLERFLAKIDKSGPGGCWLWTGATVRGLYGKFFIAKGPNREVILAYAHRWSYEHFVGPIPAGLELDHLCRVSLCVNPEHLEPVTHTENCKRTRKPTCSKGHPRPYDDQKRSCRTCLANYARERWRQQNGWYA